MKNSQFNTGKDGFNAEAFARKVGRELAEAPLTKRQTERLANARAKAMEAHAHARVPVGVLAGIGDWLHRHHVEAWHMRRAAAFSFLLLLAAGLWWQNQPAPVGNAAEEEVDAMLLSDELPPDAYLSDQVDNLTSQQGS
jgi:hypothetical protein